MKRIIAKLFLIPAAVLCVSCLEEVKPDAYLSQDRKVELSSANPTEFYEASLTGMLNNIQSAVDEDLNHNYFGQKSFDYLTSLMGNDMIMTNRYGMSIYHYLLDYWQESYTPTSNRWAEYYTHIQEANNMLKLIDPETKDPSLQYYRAAALTIRAYAYLQLTYLYQFSAYVGVEGTEWGKGEKYDFTKAPCVPLLLEDTVGDQPRSTVEKIHTQITTDLKAALTLFEASGTMHTMTATDIDGCVAALYLARQQMVLNQWDEAIKYATIVYENFPILTTEEEITQGFSNISMVDVVFGCDITPDNSTTYMSFFSQMDVYGDGYAGIGVWRGAFKPLVDRIADDDIRLKWFCCDRSTGISAEDGSRITMLRDTRYPAYIEYLSVKFIGTGRENIKNGNFAGWELGDYIYLRSEEAYFILAEAYAHKKDETNAIKYLTELMVERQPSYSYTYVDYPSLVEEIIFQKRVEFWGEGLEYLDNRRLNIPVDRTDETHGAENNNHYSGARFKWNQEDENFCYQLPITEMETNTALSPSDQN